MSDPSLSPQPDSRIERALLWLLRIVLFLIGSMALLAGDLRLGLALAGILVLHFGVHWAVPRVPALALRRWLATVADITLAAIAYYLGGATAEQALLLGGCVVAATAARLGLWQAFVVNAGVWLLFAWPPIYSWIWQGQDFSSGIVIGLVLTGVGTYGVYYFVAGQARQAKIARDLSVRLTHLSRVQEASRAISSTLDMENVLDLIVTEAAELLGAQAGALWRLDRASGQLVCLAAIGPDSRDLVGSGPPPSEAIVRRTVETGEGQLISNGRQSADSLREASVASWPEAQSVLCVPLIRRGQPIGGLEIINKLDGTGFVREDLELVSEFAAQAAIALENAQLHESTDEALRKRVEELAAIEEIDRELGSTLDCSRILDLVLRRAIEACDAHGGLVGILRSDDRQLDTILWRGGDPEFAQSPAANELALERGVIGRMLKTGQATLVSDIASDPDCEPISDSAQSELAVPIRRETRVIGVLCLVSGQVDAFSKDDLRFLEHIADHAGIAIEDARLFETQQAQLRELGILFETSTAISSSLELDEVLSAVARSVASALRVSSCSISDWDPARNAVTTLVAEEADGDRSASLSTSDIGASYSLTDYPATARVLRDRVPLVIQAADPAADLAERLLMEEMGQKSALMMPLVTRDRVVGLLELYESREHREFSSEDIRLCQALANQAAVAIDNAQLYEQTDERLRARVDELVALQRSMQELNATLERDRILDLVLELAVQTTRATHGNVMLKERETGMFVRRAAYGYTSEEEVSIDRLLSEPSPDGLIQQVVQSGRSRIVDDTRQETAVVCVRDDTRSALAVPILYQDSVAGLINLRHTEIEAFDREDQRFVQALAEQAATAIGNTMRFEEQVRVNNALRQRTEQLDALLAVSQKLRTDVALEDALEEVAYAIQETVGFNIVLISAIDDPQVSQPRLRRVAAAGLPLEVFEEARGIRQPLERYEQILRDEYRQGPCYFFPFQKQDDWASELHTMVPMAETEEWQEGEWHPRDMLLAPLRGAGGRLLGHVSVDEPRDGMRPTRRTLEVLAIFANQAAIAVENAHLYADVHRRAENLALINEVGQTLTQLVEPGQVLDTVVKAVALLLQCETSAVYQLDPVDGKFAAVASYGADLASLDALRFAPGEGLVGAVASTGEPLLVSNTEKDSRFVPGPVPVGSMMLVPIGPKQEVMGVLTAGSSRKHALTGADQLLLTTLSDQLSVALKSSRLLFSTQEAALRLASLNEIGRRVASELELQDMLETTVTSVHEYLGYERVGIFLVDAGAAELYPAATNDAFQAVIPSGHRQGIGEGLIGAAAASGETRLLNDVNAGMPSSEVANWGSLACVSVPIGIGGRVIGVLQVEADRQGRFAEDDAAALEIVADQLATSLENARLFQQAQRRVAELATVNEIGRAISSALDTDQLAELIYEQVSRLLDADSFSIALYDPDTERINHEFLVERGKRQALTTSLSGRGLTSHLIQTGEPLLLARDITQFLRDHQLEAGGETPRSWLGVPMIAKDRAIGVIAVQSFDREDAFDAGHQELLAVIAGQAAVAYQNASLFQERQQRIDQLDVLNDVAQAMSSTLELDELLKVVFQQVTRLVEADNFYIALYDENRDEIVFPFVVDPEQREDWHPRSKGEGLTGAVIESGTPLLLPVGAKGLHEAPEGTIDAGVCRSWLGVPMIAEDRVLGVIAVQDYERENVYTEEHLHLLSTVAAQAAVAVRNAQLYQQIVHFSNELEDMVEARTRDLAGALEDLTVERDRVETLYRITSELGASLELERVLERALRLLADVLGLEHGTILLFDQESGELSLRATLDRDRRLPRDGKPTRWKLGLGLAGWVMEHRRPVLVDDIDQDPRWVQRPGKKLRVRSVVAAPLSLGGGDILGVLTLGHPQEGYFTEEHLQLVSAATAQIAMAVNNSDLYAFIIDQADQLGVALQTQQEEAAKNRAVLESIADGVLVLDHNGRVLLVNPAAEDLLGFSGMALRGQHFRHMLGMGETASQRELAQHLYGELLNRLEPGGERVFRHEGSVRLQSGSQVLAATIAPLVVTPGGAPGLVAALRDISREAEVERLKNEFISTVSHELRTPMTSIKGYTDLLFLGMAGGLTDAQRDFLKIIKSNADRLTALVNDILDISRIETGRMRLTIEALDLGQIVNQVLVSFQEQYREKNLTLVWEEPEELSAIRGDAARVTQVLSNLIANAWQYTPENGTVTVTVEERDAVLQVDVADSGIGIAQEDLGRIFDRFFRADHPVVQEAAGTGLGLSIVKMFVEMLGGEIWVTSEPGVGSKFSLTLPLMSTDVPVPVPDLLGAQLAQGSTRRPKILVVEDDRDLAILLRRQLESDGYQVLLAGTGEDALWLAREAKPQLITLDVMLPDIDGFAVLERLKQNPLTSGIPVVIVSVLTETEKGYAMGAVDYVVKPFEEDQLLNVVKDAFRHLEKERPERLVVADDDAEALSLMEKALGLHGYQVWAATNGEEALAHVKECEPDLILLDTEMPVVDGYEVVRRLQADASTRSVPVILITTRPIDRERDRVEVLGTRVARYVSKPLSMEILIREIKKAIAAGPKG